MLVSKFSLYLMFLTDSREILITHANGKKEKKKRKIPRMMDLNTPKSEGWVKGAS